MILYWLLFILGYGLLVVALDWILFEVRKGT